MNPPLLERRRKKDCMMTSGEQQEATEKTIRQIKHGHTHTMQKETSGLTRIQAIRRIRGVITVLKIMKMPGRNIIPTSMEQIRMVLSDTRAVSATPPTGKAG